ncbi:MAG: cation:proton antiporter [Paludibacter sp.]|nr:cation:proton antiporter [Paludibacter sp.]
MQKKHIKTWTFYLLMLGLFVVLTYVLFKDAAKFDVYANDFNHVASVPTSTFESFQLSLSYNMAEPLAMLLMQIIAILIVSRIAGWFFIKIGQPTVIGEILAGILLGPSLLGLFYPETYNFLFAPESLGNLYILSQVGLVLFMFVIGMELNIGMLRSKMGTTYVISHASIIIPYFLGMLFAYFVYEEFASGQTDFLSFALFIGISMSITAFPVLARIVQEKGLTKTHLGQISIACAAFDDVTAWCILAAVIAIAKTGSIASSLFTIGLAVSYILFMLYVIKPFLKKIGNIYSNKEVINKSVIAFIFLILTLSAFATQLIGIHALFGAFLAGVIMPELPKFRKLIIDKIEDVALTLLLPLFFVYTGLRTEIGLLNTPHLWWITTVLILFAIAGKFFGGALSAKLMGESWRDSLSIGTLMNTRGLMEIVVLNIGYEMGILPKPIFVMLVLMALVTTFMTTPLLSLIQKIFPEKNLEEEYHKHQARGIFKVLIALGNPENGKALINVAKSVLDGVKNTLSVTALHITPGSDTNPLHSEEFARESFVGINSEAHKLEIPILNDYKISDNIEAGVVKTTNYDNYDFLLVGAGISLSGIAFVKHKPLFKTSGLIGKLIQRVTKSQEIFYPGTLIKDKTKYFVEYSQCSVGIFINRNFTLISTVLVVLSEKTDAFLIRYAHRLLKNDSGIQISILDENKLLTLDENFKSQFKELMYHFPEAVKIIKTQKHATNGFSKYSFMLISYQCWNAFIENDGYKLENIPSTLIINKKESRFSISKVMM